MNSPEMDINDRGGHIFAKRVGVLSSPVPPPFDIHRSRIPQQTSENPQVEPTSSGFASKALFDIYQEKMKRIDAVLHESLERVG